jgi:Chaperone of endosialidase
MAFNTRHPVGSTDPRDLYDNAHNLDNLVNGQQPFYPDRLGKLRHSWEGMEYDFNAAQQGRETAFGITQADKERRFEAFLASSGYVDIGPYASGVVFTERNQYVAVNGQFYRPAAGTDIPYTTTGDWATERNKFVLLGDDILRQELSILSVRAYTGVPDGTTNNQDGIVAAVAAAYAAGAELLWPAGTYVSDADIPHFHEVVHTGKGVIKRGAQIFAVSPQNKMTMRNTIHVSPSGTADGLSPDHPSNLNAAIVAIKFRGAALKGLWGIQLAAGTYEAPSEWLSNVTTDDYILIAGPDVAGGVPTAIIDAAGGEQALRIVGRCNVQLKDIKGINATASSVASAFVVDNGGTVYAQNVHTSNTQWAGINFNVAQRAVVYGGRYENSAGYGVRCYGGTVLTIGRSTDRPAFRSCTIAGVIAQGSSYGHVDYCDFTDCGIGVTTIYDSHVASLGCNFTSCATPAQAEHNSSISFDPASMTGYSREMRSRQGVQVYDGAKGRFDEQTYPYAGTNGRTAYGYNEWLAPVCKYQYSNGGTTAGINLNGFAAATALWESGGNTIIGLAAPSAFYTAIWFGNAAAANNGELRHDSTAMYYRKGGVAYFRWAATDFSPQLDNALALGGAATRWSTIYAGTGTINTSDERSKQQIKEIDDAAMRAWANVEYSQYKFNDAVDEKADGARWHFGLIAQRVKAAFEAEGLNAFDYGILCYDEWAETTAVEEQRDGEGNVIVDAVPYQPAGNRYGIRYEEALALEAALMRQTTQRLEARLSALEGK